MSKLLTHIGRFLLMLRGMFTRPETFKMYWKEFMHHTAYQLVSPNLPKSSISQVVRDTIVLELSPTLVCIVLAGVVGSKIASELGNMRVSEQIDALEIMGINTKTYLVLPKILAALLVIPMLVIIAAGMGIWGGR